MKRLLSLIFCLLLCFTLLFTAEAQNQTNLILEYDATPLKAGQSLTVELIVDNNSGFGTVTADVGFNKNNLVLIKVEKLYQPTGNYINVHLDSKISDTKNTGVYVVGYTPNVLNEGEFTAPITFNGTLVRFTFTAIKECVPEIYFVRSLMYLDDLNLTRVPHITLVKKTQTLKPIVSNISSTATTNTSSNTTSKITSDSSLTVSTGSVINSIDTTVSYAGGNIVTNPEKMVDNEALKLFAVVLVTTVVIVAMAIIVKKLRKPKKK